MQRRTAAPYGPAWQPGALDLPPQLSRRVFGRGNAQLQTVEAHLLDLAKKGAAHLLRRQLELQTRVRVERRPAERIGECHHKPPFLRRSMWISQRRFLQE